MALNLNDMAREITLIEGKHKSLPIGQVKEVLSITLRTLSLYWKNRNFEFTALMDKSYKSAERTAIEATLKAKKEIK